MHVGVTTISVAIYLKWCVAFSYTYIVHSTYVVHIFGLFAAQYQVVIAIFRHRTVSLGRFVKTA